MNRFDLLRLYFDSLPAPVSVIDEFGNYLYSNKCFYQDFLKVPYKPFDLVGKSNLDLFNPHISEIIDSNNYLAFKLGGTQCFEEHIEHSTGDFDYWLSLKKPVFSNDGEPKILISVFLNITERKLNENKLGLGIFDDNNQPFLNYIYGNQTLSYLDQGSRLISKSLSDILKNIPILTILKEFDYQSKKNLDLLTELLEVTLLNFPGNIYVRDDKFNVKFININLAKDIGINNPYDTFEKSIYEILPKEIADILAEEDKKILASDKTFFSFEHVKLIGKERCYMSYKKSLKNPYKSGQFLIGISVDYTLQKQLDTNILKAINSQSLNQKTMETFVTNISHDIRTPITGMLGLISDLKSKVDSYPDLHNKLNTLETLTSEFLSFFNGILQSVENNDKEITSEYNEPFNIEDITNSCIALFKPSLMYQDVYLSTRIPSDMPKYLIGNARMVKQIIINLLGNAVKFSESGEIKIFLTYHLKNETLQIVVSDNGIGINVSDHERIFERFTRLDLSPNSKYPGSGLGLYIVKKYLNLLNGDIKLKSRLGQGSSFTVTLPLPRATEVEKTIEDNTILFEPESKKNGRKVLIVEDNKLACLALKSMVDSLGFDVEVAMTGDEAISMSSTNHYDFIFLDLGLPDQSGIDVLLTLRSKSNYAKTPIFILSGHVTREMNSYCIQTGASAVYTKPLMLPQLKDALNVKVE